MSDVCVCVYIYKGKKKMQRSDGNKGKKKV